MSNWDFLVGKTITEATQLTHPNYIDDGYLRLKFDDGTAIVIISDYGDYSDKAQGEYPTMIKYCDDDEPSTLFVED